jgi:hypothetical protein
MKPSTLTPAWIVYAWAPVLWQSAAADRLCLVHRGTRVLNSGDADAPCSGQTLWAADAADCDAGVAWDWVELRQGVVAMSDPMGVVTNLRMVDEQGEVMSQSRLAVRLQQLVHSLPWQSEVKRVLHKPC